MACLLRRAADPVGKQGNRHARKRSWHSGTVTSASIAEVHGNYGTLEKEGPETQLLDLSDAAAKSLIRGAKKCGYLTNDQINALLSSEKIKFERIEDILAKFSEMGVRLVVKPEKPCLNMRAHACDLTTMTTPAPMWSGPNQGRWRWPKRLSRPSAPTIRFACCVCRKLHPH
jgi:hypothetical protein